MNAPRNPFAAHDPYATPAGSTAGPSGAGGSAGYTVGTPGFGPGPGAGMPAPAAPVELVIDVTEADFEFQVLERSLDVPVLLDCWAPWCGPCRSLGPLLEKLAKAYDGRFILAKINTDEAPNLSAALRIRSIPLVVLFVGGRPVDQFVGALPEGQIRQFLDRHLPADAGPQASPLERLREEIAQATPEEAEALLEEALEVEPGHPELSADLAERLLGRGEVDAAERRLTAVAEAARGERHAALAKRIELARRKPAGDPKALEARITANPKDFEARFALAELHAGGGDFNAAFDALLEVVLRDKGTDEDSWRQKARRQLVEWFAICPDAEAVSRGRRYLGMYLN